MAESRKEWKREYSTIPCDQTLNLDIISPENIIDWVKMEYLRPHLPSSGTVVEVGAGSGRLMTRIALENDKLRVVGVDFESSKMVQDNIIKFKLNGTSIQADAFHLPFKTNSVETVISGGFLEHFNEIELNSLLKEMKRILKSKGLFYAEIVPNKRSLCRPIRLTEMGGYENKLETHDWSFILKCDGFKNVKVVTGLVIPPNFYVWFRKGILLKITNRFKYVIKYLDNTWISDIFGFSYYIIARKINEEEIIRELENEMNKREQYIERL